MASLTDPWNNPAFLRDVQYKTDANLAARQSIYAYQHPRIDLHGRVLELAAPAPGAVIADVGCGNGAYLAELARRGFTGRILGLDMSPGMLAAARDRLDAVAPGASAGPRASAGPGDEEQRVGAGGGDASPGPADRQARRDAVGPIGAGASPVADPRSDPALAARGVALAVADACALPLPDGSVDLALAMHMLYHVPDPAQAVRELRRVTRPGGRVVIGLNGLDHMRQLREIVAASRGGDRVYRPERERVTLDDGEALARPLFATVTRHDFVAELRLPDPGPVEAYVRSMSGTQHGADPDRLVAEVVARFPPGPDAVLTVTTHAGCLICTVPDHTRR